MYIYASLIKIEIYLKFQGVVIADLDSKNGNTAVEMINSSYGNKKAIFIETDVTKSNQLEGINFNFL